MVAQLGVSSRFAVVTPRMPELPGMDWRWLFRESPHPVAFVDKGIRPEKSLLKHGTRYSEEIFGQKTLQ